jgi:hypothetical protein
MKEREGGREEEIPGDQAIPGKGNSEQKILGMVTEG